ncbi:MAG: Ig-like domain-containing protein, partial [Bacteroidales bacterium]|nr:Ig-like domain-containing protein [Bacteroidales bacterium]
MKNKFIKILICLPFSTIVLCYSQDIIFLHHSIGYRLFYDGNVPAWIEDYNLSNDKAFNVVERSYPDTPWPWKNYPYDYWKLWVDGSCDSDDPDIECLNTLVSDYDMIIFKHCAPGADIRPNTGEPDITSDTKSIENYQLQFRALRSLFDSYPDTKFMVWTMPPLHRLSTNPQEAGRAYEFVQWLMNDWLSEDGNPHPNIFIFDFFSQVAELEQNPENGFAYCLKYDYEISHDETDSHPNLTANQTVGPLFAQAIVDAFVGDVISVTEITVTGAGGATTISSKGGTLQFSASVVPENATNKTVTWLVENGTGEATISQTGLLTAINDGTVTVKATANDGSEV